MLLILLCVISHVVNIMSIEVKGVSKFYGKQAALNNVSFTANRGEIVGFLGPNGAGKSTMMKIITCYLPPSKGEVKVAGYDIFDHSISVRRNVGYLPETNPLYPEMYIREYLLFVAGIYGIKNKKKRVEEMIELVGLTPENHKRISELSKGYRQRVGIAQALIHDPEVIILDEPTSGLDPNQLEDIRKLIRDIGKNKTVMLSTHIMQEVEAICDRVIIIKKGEIVADAPVDLIKDDEVTESLIFQLSKPVSHKKLSAINGVREVEQLNERRYRLIVDKDSDTIRKLNALATLEGAEVEELRREEKTLEDAFKRLTR